MRAFLMTLLLGLSLPAFSQDEAPAVEPAEEKAVEAAPAEEAPAAAEEAPVAEGDEPVAEEAAEEPGADPSETEAAPPETEEPADEAEEAKAPETDEEAVATASALVDALQSKNWPLLAGLALSLLVYIAGRFGLKEKVGSKALPWVCVALAVVATVGLGLIEGLEVGPLVYQGVLAGVAAIGGWELLLKHIVPAKEEPVAVEAAVTETAPDAQPPVRPTDPTDPPA